MYQRSLETLKNKLKQYKRKYYSNILLKGTIIFFSILLLAVMSLVVLEYYGQFSSTVRTVLVYVFLALATLSLLRWVILPVKKLSNIDRELSDEEASRQIGYFFPEIKDKLLNTIQLQKNSAEENKLIQASIEQRAAALSSIHFSNAVNYKSNKKYFLRYLLIPLLVLLGILLIKADIFTESSTRLVNYKSEFEPLAPFRFEINNEKLETFRNEAFTLKVETSGDKIPDVAYIYVDGVRRKLEKTSSGHFEYEFKQLSRDKSFYMEAAGIQSSRYTLKVNERASLEGLAARLQYPDYLNKSDETVRNSGSFSVPEGTHISWQIQASATDEVKVSFDNEEDDKIIKSTSDNKFDFEKTISSSTQYQLKLKNEHGKNKGALEYSLTVIPDKYPKVSLEKYQDTLLYNYLLIGGAISDDYGLTKLQLSYKIIKDDQQSTPQFEQLDLPFQRNQLSQTYFYKFELDSLELNAGDRIEYFVTVWDNDGVNGAKSSKSQTMQFNIPTSDEIEDKISESTQATNKKIEDVLRKSKEINEKTEEVREKLKGKKEVEWEDKKDVKNVLDEHKKLKKEVQDIQENYEKNRAQQDRFQEPNKDLEDKMKQLDNLMKSMMNEEMQQLMEELEEMMDDEVDMEELQKKLDELNKKDNSLSEELDRSIELYKQLQFDQKLDQTTKKLKELSEEQKKLSEESKKGDLSEEEKDELKKKQEELNDKTERLKDQLDEMEKLNEELENKRDMDDFSDDMDQIQQEQQQSMEQMDQGKQDDASDHQKNAGDKMEEMAEKMEEMAQDMEMQALQENIDDLRMILENLVKMSFDQEALMKEIREVRQKDPRYIALSQKQLQLIDDAHIVDDSLKALAKRVFQIESFINRELDDMHKYMDGSLEELRERQTSAAAGKQQYAMTAMNNLALMLSNILEQMQNQMAQKKPGDQMCNKPGEGSQPKPGEKQGDLNEMMQQLKEDQRKGRDISEQLAKMAARQEMIRRALKEMKEKAGQKEGEGGKKLKDELQELEEMMKESEKDMVNERLDERLKERQEGIKTRLLEAEKAMREQGLDEEREAKTAEEQQRPAPPSYDEYIQEKEKQIELLKTIPLELNPYYKEKVNDYFHNIEK